LMIIIGHHSNYRVEIFVDGWVMFEYTYFYLLISMLF